MLAVTGMMRGGGLHPARTPLSAAVKHHDDACACGRGRRNSYTHPTYHTCETYYTYTHYTDHIDHIDHTDHNDHTDHTQFFPPFLLFVLLHRFL